MGKALSEMSLEELWELFPIFLTEHKDEWNDFYQKEEKRLSEILPKNQVKIHHIGSTSIKNIWAKPIIDILVEIPITISMEEIKVILTRNGYRIMSEEENRKSFNLGYTENGFAEKVFHLHLRFNGDNDELYFRDYLNENKDIAKEYENLKLSLWKKYEHNRDGYTNAKSELVKKYTECAKKEYQNRY